jgi:dolichyl-phosphate beta-glucosyltransferase
MKLSIVIPAYNEEKRLPKTLSFINTYLQKQNYDYEIVVVSDGSKDNTAQVIKNLESKIPNLRLIDNKENHGKGFVVKQGMLEAEGDYRLFTDAGLKRALMLLLVLGMSRGQFLIRHSHG